MTDSRVKVLEIELDQPLKDLPGLESYTGLHILLRWQGVPIDMLKMHHKGSRCPALTLNSTINDRHRKSILRSRIRRRLGRPVGQNPKLDLTGISAYPNVKGTLEDPLVTVAVCTRDRAQQLKNCLRSLDKLAYRNIEVLVVDNSPATDETKQLVQSQFPDFRYVIEPRPGLDWARNCAIKQASGEIIAYADDDVVVDPFWIDALVNIFQDDPAVMSVTGMVVAHELETQAQVYFERYGGFGRGFKRKWFGRDMSGSKKQIFHIGAGQFGTGANMAFRRAVFEKIGMFDPALDVGTVTNGGGDLEMFFRVLEKGHSLVYEPAALVWHQHRKTFEELRTQLTNNGIGLYSYFVRSALAYPHMRGSIFRFGLWWLWHWNIRRLMKSYIKSPRVPRELILAELRGSITGLTRYPRAKRMAKEIEAQYSDEYSSNHRRFMHSRQSI